MAVEDPDPENKQIRELQNHLDDVQRQYDEDKKFVSRFTKQWEKFKRETVENSPEVKYRRAVQEVSRNVPSEGEQEWPVIKAGAPAKIVGGVYIILLCMSVSFVWIILGWKESFTPTAALSTAIAAIALYNNGFNLFADWKITDAEEKVNYTLCVRISSVVVALVSLIVAVVTAIATVKP